MILSTVVRVLTDLERKVESVEDSFCLGVICDFSLIVSSQVSSSSDVVTGWPKSSG